MTKADWITWKTDPKEIINPDELIQEIDEYYQNYESTMHSMIYEPLKTEINNGGLNKDAFNVSGIAPANAIAQEIINTIEDIDLTVKSLEDNIRDLATKQKDLEKKQLIDSIEDKIKKEEVFLKSIESRSGLKENMKKMGNNPDDIIDIIKDRINKLRQRLDIAQSL